MTHILKLAADECGATSVEYAAIASLISVVAIGAMGVLGTSVGALWSSIPGF
ncbi:MAG TPA: Flp family type IVb pilin [Sphingomicrobium sp.]|nr:Flp family type IVb pilin [Sphingomicrobium sp.]